MSFGDFLKGVGGGALDLALDNPIGHGLKQGANYLGEQFISHQSETARRTPGLPEPEAGHGQMMPGQPGRNFRLTGESHVANVAEEWNKQNVANTEAIMGAAKVARAVVTHPRRSAQTAQTVGKEVWNHPGILVDAAKATATDMAVGAALNPTTYMGGGMLFAAEMAEQSAARGAEKMAVKTGEKALLETGEKAVVRAGTHSADDLAGRVVAHSADDAARALAPKGLDKALVDTARRANPNWSARLLEKIDVGDANLRETITGNPMGKLGQKRFDLGERLMPGPQTSVLKQLGKDAIQASPTMPSEGAALGYRTAKWRATQVGRRLAMPAQARTARRVGQIMYDPKRALTDPTTQDLAGKAVNWAIDEHPQAAAVVGGLVAANAALGMAGTVQSVLGAIGAARGGDDKDKAEAAPYTAPPIPDTTQAIGLQQFRLDNTRSTRTSRRQPNSMAQLGTVTADSTMPTQIGPKDWYGPQGGYDAGRGFQQRTAKPTGPLSPLEQPKEVVGI